MHDMVVNAGEMVEASGARNVSTYSHVDRIPGYGIHELGSARRGSDPKQSVQNQFQQSRCEEFVCDGCGGGSVGGVSEPYVDDYGDGGAVVGLFDGGA